MATEVFAITELLEQILLNLSTIDLFLAQRVTKHFKATIGGSLHLRQALFFTPTSCDEDADWAGVQLNPLLCNLVERCSPHEDERAAFELAINPESLHPRSSAWRMLLVQPPKLYYAYVDTRYVALPLYDIRDMADAIIVATRLAKPVASTTAVAP